MGDKAIMESGDSSLCCNSYSLCLLSDRFGANVDSKLQFAKESNCNRQMEDKSREELFRVRTASARYLSLLKT